MRGRSVERFAAECNSVRSRAASNPEVAARSSFALHAPKRRNLEIQTIDRAFMRLVRLPHVTPITPVACFTYSCGLTYLPFSRTGAFTTLRHDACKLQSARRPGRRGSG